MLEYEKRGNGQSENKERYPHEPLSPFTSFAENYLIDDCRNPADEKCKEYLFNPDRHAADRNRECIGRSPVIFLEPEYFRDGRERGRDEADDELLLAKVFSYEEKDEPDNQQKRVSGQVCIRCGHR